MRDEEVDAARLNVTAFADANGRHDGHEDEEDGREDDERRLPYAGLGDDPTRAEKDDDAKDVDETGGEDAVPSSEENSLGDEKV